MENVVTQNNPKGKNSVKNLVPTPISIPMCAVCALGCIRKVWSVVTAVTGLSVPVADGYARLAFGLGVKYVGTTVLRDHARHRRRGASAHARTYVRRRHEECAEDREVDANGKERFCPSCLS